ncbi:MFS transporter [Litoribacillus peritrichatus]|uniref:Major facilitator superfamily domain-containing protein 6 n=1 Tax=Litoribacillus peritrichatus TaxID=718191 RepID=A0ABP7MD24_9GAMM
MSDSPFLSDGRNDVIPAFKLSSFYFCYFAFLGCLLPFWPIFLSEKGFDGLQIAAFHAVFLSTKIFAPSIAGYLSDRFNILMSVIRCSLIFAGISFSFYILGFDYLELIVIGVVYSVFWNAILSQFEAYTLCRLDSQANRYSRIRLWGSIGFIVLSFSLGVVFEWLSIQWLPFIMIALIVFASYISFQLSELAKTEESDPKKRVQKLMPVLKKPAVVSFLLICFFIQLSHGAYYSFYSLYLEGYGFSNYWIGGLWSVGVVAEIILFLIFPYYLKKYGEYVLLVLSIILTVLRWLVIGYFPESLSLVLFAQGLHAFSFGCLHVVSMVYVQRFFPSGLSGRGQALYSGVSFGLGGAIGAIISGFLWESGLERNVIFYVAAVSAFLALLVSVRLKPQY